MIFRNMFSFKIILFRSDPTGVMMKPAASLRHRCACGRNIEIIDDAKRLVVEDLHKDNSGGEWGRSKP